MIEIINYMVKLHTGITYPNSTPYHVYEGLKVIYQYSQLEKFLLYYPEFWDKLLSEKYKS